MGRRTTRTTRMTWTWGTTSRPTVRRRRRGAFWRRINVEAGGHTHFPRLNISVRPKRGSALLWPSVLDHDPNERDDRTDHEALPVASGTKYAANYWLHMYRYRGLDGCDNQAYSDNWY